jgi:hypothetical protein
VAQGVSSEKRTAEEAPVTGKEAQSTVLIRMVTAEGGA